MSRAAALLVLLTLHPPGRQAPAIGSLAAQLAPQLDTTYGCIACHADKRTAFVLGVHAERGIQCHNCHGGDPTQSDLPGGHRGQFVGTPGKTAIVALCGSCHSDPDQMRQYGLQTGQVAEFRTSRHGRLLLGAGDQNAPTCTDCHDAHTILKPDDARSTVYPTNIATTCARCHENQSTMGRYGIATDQVQRFTNSAHGKALYERQNFASPSCVGCHGSHSALPPTVTEVSNVCGRCHVRVGQALTGGLHANAVRSGALAGCLGCHSNHDTERVPADQIETQCAKCHEDGSPPREVGAAIQRDVVQATADLEAGEEALGRLTATGRHTSDAHFRYQTALTSYLQIAEVQHSLDLDRLEELTRRVRSISRNLRGAAEVAEEHQWEHKLLMVPVWFLALACVALAWLWLRAHERSGQG